MKLNRILVLSIIILAAIGCKKHKSELPSPPAGTPPGEKQWKVSTIAGDGRPVFFDGPVLSASFRLPFDVAVSSDGIIYVADLLNHRVRKITGGMVNTFAGIGAPDTAKFTFPSRLTVDMSDNLYTLDFGEGRVRKITTTGAVSTYAGSVEKGFRDGPVATAQFSSDFGIVADPDGNIYIGDSGNKRIRKININGQVITIAGTGEQGFTDANGEDARFFFPQGIVIDKQGNLFVADQNRIRKITPAGIVSTFAGSELLGFKDGQANEAQFSSIEDLVIDKDDNIYASDDNRIRKISPQGIVSTIAGTSPGFQDGEGHDAKFNGALGLGIDKQGSIYVADGNNNRIRKISYE